MAETMKTGERLTADLREWLVAEPRGYSFVARIVHQVVERDMVTVGQRRRVLDAAAAAQPGTPRV